MSNLIKCAIIKDGVVINVIEYKSVPVGTPSGFEEGCIAIKANSASTGWLYDGVDFKDPVPPIYTPPPTYQELRVAEYPPIEDYLDGIAKADDLQVQKYIDACLAVKAKYPKGNK